MMKEEEIAAVMKKFEELEARLAAEKGAVSSGVRASAPNLEILATQRLLAEEEAAAATARAKELQRQEDRLRIQNALISGAKPSVSPAEESKRIAEDGAMDPSLRAFFEAEAEAEAEAAAKAKKLQEDERLAAKFHAEYELDMANRRIAEDHSYAVALTYQYGLGATRSAVATEETSSDALIAAMVAQEIRETGIPPEMNALCKEMAALWGEKTEEERNSIEKRLAELCVSSAVKGRYASGVAPPEDLTNAHADTKEAILKGIPVVVAIGEQLKLNNDSLPLEQVQKEALDFAVDNKISAEDIVFITQTFSEVRASAPVDTAETQANIHHWLSKAWALAKQLGLPYKRALVSCLVDNKKDTGGCMPGVIARVYPRVVSMLFQVVEQLENNRRLALALRAAV